MKLMNSWRKASSVNANASWRRKLFSWSCPYKPITEQLIWDRWRVLQRSIYVLIALLGCANGAAAITASVTASQAHGLMLNASGSVCAVGQNENGELGDGTAVDRSVPVAAALTGSFGGVTTGWYHSLAVKQDGTVWAWGFNGNGQLGDGTQIAKPTPIAVPGLTGMLAVAAGKNHSLALKNDGTVLAWGYNDYGELGDGTNTTRLSPVPVISLGNVIAIAAGNQTSFALKSDGTVWAWGFNGQGQLGDGTNLPKTSAVQVAGLTGVVSMAAGAAHTLALKSDGTVWAWGYNPDGELGDGSNTSRPNPVRASSLTGVTALAAGDNHSLAVKSDGTVWAWGYNLNGQLGNGTVTASVTPIQVTALSNVSGVAGGSTHSLAVRNDGSFWAWGNNTYGQLGNGTATSSLLPVALSACISLPSPGLPNSSLVHRVTATQNSSLALVNTDTVLAWGQNQNGQLGDGTTISRSTAVQSAGLVSANAIAAGWYHSLAVKQDGTVWAWGFNGNGQLGDGTQIAKPTPIAVPGLTGMLAVAAGKNHSLALKNDGTVLAWGYNDYGELGDGTNTTRLSPVPVISLGNVIAIAAGNQTSFALKSDGTVWAWGFNGQGQLGDGTNLPKTSAVQVAGLTGVVSMAAGAAHTLALKSDGTVWAWGYNPDGELGDGSNTSRPNPVRASSLTGVTALAAGDNHSLAVKSDGTVWAWGYNLNGQLGNGTVTASSVPVQTTAMPSPALAVAAGTSHSLALLRNGYIYAWGSNANGQFGTGTTSDSTVPVRGPFVGAIYSLSLNASNSGVINTNPPSSDGNYTANRKVCLSTVPVVGQIFAGWSGSTLDTNNCLTLSADTTVSANFAPTPPLRFIPLPPCRIADTRSANGPFGGPAIPGQNSRDFAIPQSACNVPSTAAAYSLNVTVIPSGPLSYLTAWPAGSQRPGVSVLNSDGRVKANAAIIPAGSNGAVSVYATNTTHVILDINGYFVPASDPTALAFYPIQPCRLADTRNAAGPLGGPSLSGGLSRTFPILTSSCGLPNNAQAFALNFTAIPRANLGYLTVWPPTQQQPGVSTLNAGTGAVTANAAIVPADPTGGISVYASDDTGLIIDVNGYFAASGTGGLALYNVPPCRIFDTRTTGNTQPFSGTIGVNATTASCNVPTGAQALALNATVVPSGALGYLSLWPFGQPQPGVSTLNASDGAITSNLAIAPDTAGSINAFTSNQTHLLLDISSYFAPVVP